MSASPRRRHSPRSLTSERLEKAALDYLERFASSRANLVRMLERRVRRAALAAPETDVAALEVAIDAIVLKFAHAGLLNDAAYAEQAALSLFRRGLPPRRIAATLRRKGVGEKDIRRALAALAEVASEPELAAACAFVRRRRLGPCRGRARNERRARDLAALARAGFSLEVARRVLAAETLDTLEELEKEARELA
jgi:regulatory protein